MVCLGMWVLSSVDQHCVLYHSAYMTAKGIIGLSDALRWGGNGTFQDERRQVRVVLRDDGLDIVGQVSNIRMPELGGVFQVRANVVDTRCHQCAGDSDSLGTT